LLRRGSIDAVTRQLERLLPLLVVAVACVFALRRLDDFDVWWHLAAGRWIVGHRAVPHADTLSYMSAGRPWINLQWLYEVLLYALYQVGGAGALVLAAALLFGLATAVLVCNLRLAVTPLGAAVIGAWVTAIAQERFSVRPEMASFLLVQALLWVFATARRDEGRRLWLVPLLMLLWVNVHTLFMIGIFIILCHMAGVVAARVPLLPRAWQEGSVLTPAARRRVLLAGTVSVLVTVVNPYFTDGALYPFRLLTYFGHSNVYAQTIGELHSPFSGYFPTPSVGAYQLFFFYSVGVVGLAGVLTALAGRRGRALNRAARRRAARPGAAIAPGPAAGGERFDIADVAVFCGLAYLSVLARRNMAVFALIAAPFVAQCSAVVHAHLFPAARRTWEVMRGVLIVVMPPALLALAWFVASNGYYRWTDEVRETGAGILEANFPVRAVAFARQLEVPPRLFNDVASGGYLTWDSPVDGGPYIDGRLGLDDPQFFAAYQTALSKPERWQQEADRVGIGTVLLFHRWMNRWTLIQWLQRQPQWALVYLDEVAVVFVRRAGHEALIEKSRPLFLQALQASVQETSLSPVATWQWPVGRMSALAAYAQMLDMLRDPDDAVKVFSRLLELHPVGTTESRVRVRLAGYYAGKGDLNTARLYLTQAEQADPHNDAVRALRAKLGG
jgi:hypothetical protein